MTKSEVKNKIHNMKKKYVKLQQNALKGYPDNWEWTSRIKNLFHDLDIKSVTLLGIIISISFFDFFFFK